MFVFQMLFALNLVWAATEMPVQQDVDHAFDLILSTKVGKAICRDILGAAPDALELHLGISRDRAIRLAGSCRDFEASEWIYPTSPADIRKLAIKADKPRRYKLVHSDAAFPIESWTDSISNITTIVTSVKPVPFVRMVQILAHETAVYFDSKSHPLHPGAQEIPHLRALNLKAPGQMDPLLAASNPLQAHTLTYLRALQVEFAIMRELIDGNQLAAPADLNDDYLQFLTSERCGQLCIGELLNNTRAIYMPFNLPLIAFSPHYRAVALQNLPSVKAGWTDIEWADAQQVLSVLPVQFIKNQFTGDVVDDLARFFFRDHGQAATYERTDHFLRDVLWPIEWKSLAASRLPNGTPLLEFLKQPLLSGYNISLSSGPRVRVRTGNIE